MLSVAKIMITTVVVILYYPIVLTELLWGVWQSSNAAITQPHETNLKKTVNRLLVTQP